MFRLTYFCCLLLLTLISAACGKQGCTDVRAENYEEGLKYDDGSCVYCACKDTSARNYNKNAFCAAADSCTYVTDEYVDRYEGWAVINADTSTITSDTVDSFYIVISKEMLRPNILQVNENGTLITMDTACGFTSFGHTDTSYVILFETYGAPNPTTPDCLNRFPTRFEFILEGDSMTYLGQQIDNNIAGGVYREILFSGKRAD